MIINIQPLKGRKGDYFDFGFEVTEQTRAELPQIIRQLSPWKVSGRITNTGRGLYVEGTVQVAAELQCTRCLDKFQQLISGTFAEEFLPSGHNQDGGAESLQDWLDEAPTYSGDALDISDLLRDTLVLAVPMQTVCSSQCSGLCSQCGRSLNTGSCDCALSIIDPRLAVLEDLFKES